MAPKPFDPIILDILTIVMALVMCGFAFRWMIDKNSDTKRVHTILAAIPFVIVMGLKLLMK